jgi:hypothetical protein
MVDMRISKHIQPFSGSDYVTTPTNFLAIVQSDVDSKLGEEPLAWTNGADPEHVGPGNAPNPHRSRDWKNYTKKRQGLLAGYLTGRAREWLKNQITADPIYCHDFPQVEADFIAHFNTDVNKGAAEIRLQSLKRADNQTIDEWNENISNLVEQAFSHEPAAAQAEKVRH